MKEIQVICPHCNERGHIEIPEDSHKDTSRGLLAVNIASNIICPHDFIMYIDRNFHIRDYFTTDFQIELPEISPPKKFEDLKLPEKDVINIDLIKLNTPAILIVHILKSIFLKKEITLIIEPDLSFLNDHLINFLHYVTRDSFDFDMEIITSEEYKKNKKKYKDIMVFEGDSILRNVKKVIDPKKLKIERHIVMKFLTETDLAYSYLLFKNEIQKAHFLAKSVADFINNYKQIEKPKSKEISEDSMIASILENVVSKEKVISMIVSDYLKDEHNVKVHKDYLNFLIDIVEHYFNVDIHKKVEMTAI